MFAPYWSLYLQSIHFSAIEIGILMSTQPVMRMVAPNIWGWLADHTGKRREGGERVVCGVSSSNPLDLFC
jgi:MFS family permease